MQIRRIFLSFLAVLSFSGLAFAQSGNDDMIETAAPPPPLALTMQTGDLTLLNRGTLRFTFGASYGTNFCQPYTGLCGNLWRHGNLRLQFGIANNVNLMIEGAPYQTLDIDSARSFPLTGAPASGQTRDIGDFTIATIWRARREREGGMPALGFKIAVKLPNSNEHRGIGTNTIDYIASSVITKHWGESAALMFESGLGIFGQPQNGVAQDDMIVYGLAGSFKLTDRFRLWSEIAGRTSTGGSTLSGTENRGNATLGLLWGGKSWNAEFTLSHGIYRYDPNLTAGFALSFQGRVLKRISRSN